MNIWSIKKLGEKGRIDFFLSLNYAVIFTPVSTTPCPTLTLSRFSLGFEITYVIPPATSPVTRAAAIAMPIIVNIGNAAPKYNPNPTANAAMEPQTLPMIIGLLVVFTVSLVIFPSVLGMLLSSTKDCFYFRNQAGSF